MDDPADDAHLIQYPDWFKAPQIRFPDTDAVVSQRFTSIEEAEAYALKLGVVANYASGLRAAELANEALKQLHVRNLPLPLSVIYRAEPFAKFGAAARNAIAMAEAGVLFLKPGVPYFDDPLTFAANMRDIEYWSTPHPLHPLFHEAGHFAQATLAEKQKPLTPRQARIADSVSDRAKVDADEFVAEVFAGLLSEVQYDADILRLYHTLGGRKI